MAVPGTSVSFTDLKNEYGGTGAVSASDYYRGGANIRAKAANNTADNLAANVPTSGAVSFSEYRNTEKGFKKTYSAGATDQDGSVIFGDDWAVDYPKTIKINSGVELGTTNTGDYALELDTGALGTIVVDNSGTITGAGGAAGAAGGTAMRVEVSSVTVNNSGTIRGGGGGGGNGGSGGSGGNGGSGGGGGQGRVISCLSPAGIQASSQEACRGACQAAFSNNPLGFGSNSCGSTPIPGPEGEVRGYICNCNDDTYYNGGAGGSGGSGGSGASGGAGGVGAGYGQSAGTGGAGGTGTGGSAGSSGGAAQHPSAGAGGAGGTGGAGGDGGSGGAGGSFGSAGSSGSTGLGGSTGSTGSSGANGNFNPGSAGSGGAGGNPGSAGGSAGGAGGAVSFSTPYTMNNSGTIQGTYT